MMGLSTTHDCWYGAYSGFQEFRKALGRAAKVDVDRDVDWDDLVAGDGRFEGDWGSAGPNVKAVGDAPPLTDPVLYLLIHYDDTGKLRLEYLPALKARLEELLPAYREATDGDEYLAGRLDQFIAGIGRAIDAGEHVRFY